MTRIAFIGLGAMGAPMAANLVKAGHEVIGHDLKAEARDAAAAAGVPIASSGAEAVARAEVVVTMLPAALTGTVTREHPDSPRTETERQKQKT